MIEKTFLKYIVILKYFNYQFNFRHQYFINDWVTVGLESISQKRVLIWSKTVISCVLGFVETIVSMET